MRSETFFIALEKIPYTIKVGDAEGPSFLQVRHSYIRVQTFFRKMLCAHAMMIIIADGLHVSCSLVPPKGDW
jgi:hypothetical protein